jgi:hypothetical protein
MPNPVYPNSSDYPGDDEPNDMHEDTPVYEEEQAPAAGITDNPIDSYTDKKIPED